MASKSAKVIAVDLWDIALETFKYNLEKRYANVEVIKADLTTFDYSVLPKRCYLLRASPPCQDFSTLNSERSLDTTNIEKFLEIRDYMRPKYWVMEEVVGVGKIGVTRGFWSKPRYLNAKDFYLPHVRRRLFQGDYPEPDKRPYDGNTVPTPIAASKGYGYCWNQRRVMDYVFFKLNQIIDSSTDRERQMASFKKMMDRVSFPDCNEPKIKRIISKRFIKPYLYAWLMGFPSDYQFAGDRYLQYRQIGNAVCPPVAKAIYLAIKTKKKPPKATKMSDFY
jgi:site-specific DNA-cytosine methylase